MHFRQANTRWQRPGIDLGRWPLGPWVFADLQSARGKVDKVSTDEDNDERLAEASMKTDTASLEARYGERVGRDSQLLVAAQRKVAGAFALAVVLAIGIGLVSFWSVSRLGDDAAWVGHSRQVIGSLQELLSTLASTQSASRGYAITGSESFLRPYSQAVGSVRLELANLRELIADNPEQQARAQALSSRIDERMRISENIVAIRRERGTESAREFIANGRGEQVQDSIRQLIR